MMGERTGVQGALFYGFSLERHVPTDHLLRAIDRFVDLGTIRQHLRPFYSETGRPSIDPELMIRMLLIGLLRHPLRAADCCDEVHLGWFCRLGLEACRITPRSQKNRAASDAAANCEAGCEGLHAERLVGGDGFAVDAGPSAEANRQRFHGGEQGLQRAVLSMSISPPSDAAFGAATPVVHITVRISPSDPLPLHLRPWWPGAVLLRDQLPGRRMQ